MVEDSLETFNRIFGSFSKCSNMFTDGGLLVCKKWTNIGTLHQLVNTPSDKMGWWHGRLRIYDRVLEIESTVVEFWKSFVQENGKCRDKIMHIFISAT
eukprot:scaffold83696_cov68-Attheya_sp.AAC.1